MAGLPRTGGVLSLYRLALLSSISTNESEHIFEKQLFAGKIMSPSTTGRMQNQCSRTSDCLSRRSHGLSVVTSAVAVQHFHGGQV